MKRNGQNSTRRPQLCGTAASCPRLPPTGSRRPTKQEAAASAASFAFCPSRHRRRKKRTSTQPTNATAKSAKPAAASGKNGKSFAKELRGTAPKRTGAYAKDWTSKQTGANARGAKTYTVYNKAHYQLTHLLQNGHKGPAPAPAYPHIDRPAEKWQQEFVTECEEATK